MACSPQGTDWHMVGTLCGCRKAAAGKYHFFLIHGPKLLFHWHWDHVAMVHLALMTSAVM